MTLEYRLARPDERPLAEALAARAFGPGRFAKSAYRLRDGVHPDTRLSFVAVKDGQIAGTIQYWPVAIGGALCVLLGPLAVEQAARGSGAGLKLMRLSLPEAARLGYVAAILVGDEPYYAKVGFKRAPQGSLEFPGPVNPGRLLLLQLNPIAPEPKGRVERSHLDEPQAAPSCGLAKIPARA